MGTDRRAGFVAVDGELHAATAAVDFDERGLIAIGQARGVSGFIA